MPKEKYSCSVCNKEFLRYSSQQKSSLLFCSNKCRSVNGPPRKRNRLECFCSNCGKSYERIVSRARKSSFCSKDCMYLYLRENSWLCRVNKDRFNWLTEGLD